MLFLHALLGAPVKRRKWYLATTAAALPSPNLAENRHFDLHDFGILMTNKQRAGNPTTAFGTEIYFFQVCLFWSVPSTTNKRACIWSGTLPQDWAGLTNLTQLDISSNTVTGSLPGAWGASGRWPLLQGLNLSSNGLTGKRDSDPRMG